MGLGKPFCLLAYIRIDSTNNVLRYNDGAGDADLTLTTGVYPLGFGDGNPDGANDSASFGVSFFERLNADFATAGDDFNFALQTEYNSGVTGMANSATGHVFCEAPSASANLQFGHANTTMNPRWFGSEAVTFSSFTGSGTYDDISTFSSSLAFVGDRGILNDRPLQRTFSSQIVARSGRTIRNTYKGTLHGRDLEFQMEGVLREGVDTVHSRLLRFTRALRENGAAGRFIYFPDLAQFGNAWDPDGTGDDRYGYQILVPVDVTDLEWDQDPTDPPSQLYWRKGWASREYVALS